ncbi:DUF1570 domain-containing protein [Altererythrobacter luteolus]|uniref:DUF1570 domain-containing protein n=1 Tax=Pontixanthobacter luteolus TaxID=295089 RepID=A0A6I4V082_9SPHN|nr:DUF1570 domain-containing protein [Pontixanthobacter luteolus]MXP47125.1 DUF1570 domain-containing protein [Pontixanthobacter luteolus]
MIYRLLALVAASFLVLPNSAQAKWRVAESDYFVVYADDSEKDIREFAQMLESYHAAMEYVSGRTVPKPSPSNRVTIFAVGSRRSLQKLYGENSRYIGGFYVPRAGGSRAFVPDIRMSNREPTASMRTLLHEYAHHFMISGSRFAMPRWINEGAAEFFASAKFPANGNVVVGRPANHRANELFYADKVSVRELFDRELYAENRGKRYDAFYGRSWLLYHYLTFNQERQGQMRAYLAALVGGQDALDAAQSAFGDLDQLEDELDKYQRAKRMYNFTISPDKLETGAITVREVSEGHDKVLPLQIVSQRGVNREEAIELLEEVREIAEEYPADAAVQAVLAEAEHDAGNYAEAIAAADRAIAANSGTKNAYIQKGYSLFRLAADAEDRGKAYGEAMVPFSKLNKLENDHPLPLIHYYRSYAERGLEPPEQAKHALERAAQLAPFDQGLWMRVGRMQAQEGKIGLASHSVRPLMANPHGGRLAAEARRFVAALEKAPEGEPFDVSMLSSMPVVEIVPTDGDDEGASEPDGADESGNSGGA